MEALAAGIILAVSGGVLGMAVTQGMRSLALARDYQEVTELLDETLTKIDMIGPASLLSAGPTEGRFGPPHERFAWSAEMVSGLEGHLYDVTVRITWQTPGGGQRSVEVQTFLNDYGDPDETGPGWNDL